MSFERDEVEEREIIGSQESVSLSTCRSRGHTPVVTALPQGFSLKGLRHLVLDEADKLLDMDFEAEIDQILKV